MKILLLVSLVSVLSGCAVGTIKTTPAGDCEARFGSLFKSADRVDLCGASAKNTQNSDQINNAILSRILGIPAE